MKLRHLAAAAMLLASAMQGAANAPEGYYSSLEGKSSGELKTAIHNLVCNFTLISSYNNLPQYFAVTDVYPQLENGKHRWWDMYSDMPLYAPSFKGLNREHSFPKSWWGGSTSVSAYIDLNHLYPSEAAANMAKSNYPLGEVDRSENVRFQNGITTVGYPVLGQGGGATQVFEPDDEYKGDFARTYFYMVTCYQNLTWKYTYMVNQNLFPTLNNWSSQLLMRWHRADPVSEKELQRNDKVYGYQANRNPFIDHPELAEYLWGDRVGDVYHVGASGTPSDEADLQSPVNGMSLDFGQVAIGHTATADLFFKGTGIRKDLTISIYKGDKAMFSLPVSKVSAQLINRDEGTWVRVSYTPTAIGEHTARILIEGTGADGNGTRGVELRGECLAVPTLTAPTATAATDITADSYVANWTPVAGETVDYYIVTRTRYVGGVPTTEELLAETPGVQIFGFDLSDSESYSVRSCRLGVQSAESNVVFVSHTGITDAEMDVPFTVATDPGLIVVRTVAATDICVYDMAGRLLQLLPGVHGVVEIPMPAGVYIVATGRGTAPAKVTVL